MKIAALFKENLPGCEVGAWLSVQGMPLVC